LIDVLGRSFFYHEGHEEHEERKERVFLSLDFVIFVSFVVENQYGTSPGPRPSTV
jgi:hypothetical protein